MNEATRSFISLLPHKLWMPKASGKPPFPLSKEPGTPLLPFSCEQHFVTPKVDYDRSAPPPFGFSPDPRLNISLFLFSSVKAGLAPPVQIGAYAFSSPELAVTKTSEPIMPSFPPFSSAQKPPRFFLILKSTLPSPPSYCHDGTCKFSPPPRLR